MSKQYIKPELDILEILPEDILTSSGSDPFAGEEDSFSDSGSDKPFIGESDKF